ncbi:MAG: epoxyqueuosine reductase [Thermoclostridium sp.]|nr:epoxyqueuosine reductase [Thermoclostridium sp.]
MKNAIKEIFLSLGSDLCGVANIDRFDNAPKGFHPLDIYDECKSVIVFAKVLPKGTAKVSPRIIYQHFNQIGPIELDRIAYEAALKIERAYNCCVVPIPSDGPYEYWDEEKLEGRGLISMKHSAVNAGIGTLGKSTMLLNSQFGSMLSLSAVLTNLDLASDPFAEEICIKSCRVCVESCPVNALDGNSVNQALCRTNAYGVTSRGFDIINCNKCRVVCPRAFGK